MFLLVLDVVDVCAIWELATSGTRSPLFYSRVDRLRYNWHHVILAGSPIVLASLCTAVYSAEHQYLGSYAHCRL